MPAPSTVEQPAELLAYLFAAYSNEKKTKVRQWLKHGAVQVNGRSITQFNHPLEVGDVVTFAGKEVTQAASELPAGLKVLYEDAALLVIEKPARLLSMASETERERTAYAFLTTYVRRGDATSADRVWIVHRLDRDASGLMVFAKTEAVKQALQAEWHKAEKKYLAIVEGALPADSGKFESHLNESAPFKVFSAPPSDRTRLAITNYQVLKRGKSRTLVEVRIETGRRNQIRVHMADAGCPIVGDRKYGAKTNAAHRLALHAAGLSFAHPVSGETLKFESALPRELAGLV